MLTRHDIFSRSFLGGVAIGLAALILSLIVIVVFDPSGETSVFIVALEVLVAIPALLAFRSVSAGRWAAGIGYAAFLCVDVFFFVGGLWSLSFSLEGALGVLFLLMVPLLLVGSRRSYRVSTVRRAVGAGSAFAVLLVASVLTLMGVLLLGNFSGGFGM